MEVTGTHYSVEVKEDKKQLDFDKEQELAREENAKALMAENMQLKEQLEQAQNDAGVYKEKYRNLSDELMKRGLFDCDEEKLDLSEYNKIWSLREAERDTKLEVIEERNELIKRIKQARLWKADTCEVDLSMAKELWNSRDELKQVQAENDQLVMKIQELEDKFRRLVTVK